MLGIFYCTVFVLFVEVEVVFWVDFFRQKFGGYVDIFEVFVDLGSVVFATGLVFVHYAG